MLIDLHLHSYYSDGTDSPDYLIQSALKLNLKIISITDHGCVESYLHTCAAAPQTSYDIKTADIDVEQKIQIIAGVEINCASGLGEVHILGYYIDTNNSDLTALLNEIQHYREERAYEMIFKLNTTQNMNLSINVLKQLFPNTISFGKPHIGYLLKHYNYTKSIEESFERYLDKGMPGYVPRHKVLVPRACEIIKKAGGIPFLAHPLELKSLQTGVRVLKHLGVMGLECFYSKYSNPALSYGNAKNIVEELIRTARENKLFICGGSDYHGWLKDVKFNGVDVPASYLREWMRCNVYQ
ncbi:MAG: PHP domain-containing protein [Candidatus Hydrogenedentota bacterium]